MNGTTKQLSVKVFVGFPVAGELKISLSQSKEWNLLRILPVNQRKKISIAKVMGKEFIGIYLPEAPHSVTQLRKIEEELRTLVHQLCDKIHPNRLNLNVLTQPFIS